MREAGGVRRLEGKAKEKSKREGGGEPKAWQVAVAFAVAAERAVCPRLGGRANHLSHDHAAAAAAAPR